MSCDGVMQDSYFACRSYWDIGTRCIIISLIHSSNFCWTTNAWAKPMPSVIIYSAILAFCIYILSDVRGRTQWRQMIEKFLYWMADSFSWRFPSVVACQRRSTSCDYLTLYSADTRLFSLQPLYCGLRALVLIIRQDLDNHDQLDVSRGVPCNPTFPFLPTITLVILNASWIQTRVKQWSSITASVRYSVAALKLKSF